MLTTLTFFQPSTRVKRTWRRASGGAVARAMRAVDHLAWWIEYQTAPSPSRSRNLRPCRAPSSAARTRPTYDGEARTPSRSEGR